MLGELIQGGGGVGHAGGIDPGWGMGHVGGVDPGWGGVRHAGGVDIEVCPVRPSSTAELFMFRNEFFQFKGT